MTAKGVSRSPSPTEKHNEQTITAIKTNFIAIQYNKRADAYQKEHPQITQTNLRNLWMKSETITTRRRRVWL